MARWASLRSAIGIMRGAPADAIEDTDALYDDDSPMVGFRYFGNHAIPARDIPGTPEWHQAHRAEQDEIIRRGRAAMAAAREKDFKGG